MKESHFTDDNVEPDTTYTYKVKAVASGAVDSEYSKSVKITTPQDSSGGGQ